VKGRISSTRGKGNVGDYFTVKTGGALLLNKKKEGNYFFFSAAMPGEKNISRRRKKKISVSIFLKGKQIKSFFPLA